MEPLATDLSVLAGLPLEDALERLRQMGISAQVVETRPPGRTLIGDMRVLAIRRHASSCVLVVGRSWPLPDA